ncbi:hypothetical protein M885DRAFT_504595 [Pelagophyceae sp. CCMP2097]|nr:hypothetical protein M885DRAFT_504595 [Pelagophyceae sp. CCMP2097]
MMRVASKAARVQLYDKAGNAKLEGDAPLGIAYDEDGCPVPDWELVFDPTDESRDANGRRCTAKIVGAINVDEHLHLIKRAHPDWGKKFGQVMKPQVGYFGAYTVDTAKLCLCTEDFGWKLGDDAHLAPTPPYIRLCYGEHHGEQDSIRLFTGLSEIHLLKDLDLTEVHHMIQGLGYVSYNTPNEEEDRWWGEGVDVFPQRVTAGLAGGKGPIFYSWFYRLPPWMPGLVLEGEAGDPLNGPLALKLRKKYEHEDMMAEKLAEDRVADLKRRAQEQQRACLAKTAAAAEDDDDDAVE